MEIEFVHGMFIVYLSAGEHSGSLLSDVCVSVFLMNILGD